MSELEVSETVRAKHPARYKTQVTVSSTVYFGYCPHLVRGGYHLSYAYTKPLINTLLQTEKWVWVGEVPAPYQRFYFPFESPFCGNLNLHPP